MAWLERYDVWATGRHEHVHSILTDWRTFMSGAGVGLIDLRVDAWRPPSLLLEADPPDHTVVRSIIERVLSPRAVKILRERFSARADTLVDRFVGAGSFDAMEELARVFPVEVFADEVGVSEDGRENLLPYGDMVFNGQGPRNEYFREGELPERTWRPAASAWKFTRPPTPARSPTSRPVCWFALSFRPAWTPR